MPRGEFDRSVRKAQTRARLLQAAASVYARRGFSGATLDEVAAEAGFTKGAVYAHFGSKENLLVALLEEHLANQAMEQVALFDRERITWERPLAGSAHWMERVQENPEPFRLFVELWSYAQRDERLRERLLAGLAVLRETFASFAATSAADAGFESPREASEQFATIMLALGAGMQMLKLIDPDAVPTELLGTVLSVLIKAAESSPEARELLEQTRLGASAPPGR
jgi:AcrR family transcriptional regulator